MLTQLEPSKQPIQYLPPFFTLVILFKYCGLDHQGQKEKGKRSMIKISININHVTDRVFTNESTAAAAATPPGRGPV